jgi:hypothetical protein
MPLGEVADSTGNDERSGEANIAAEVASKASEWRLDLGPLYNT